MPTYATASDLRLELELDAAALPDPQANRELATAEDLVDRLVGNWAINPATGRKLTPSSLTAPQVAALARATVLLAAAEHRDPGSLAPPAADHVQGPDFMQRGLLAAGPRGATTLRQAVAILDANRLRNLLARLR